MLAWKQRPFKECVTAHWSRGLAWIIGYKADAEGAGSEKERIGRGAFQVRRMQGATHAGAHGKANVGMSNDKGARTPAARPSFPGDASHPGVSRALSLGRMAMAMADTRLRFRDCPCGRCGNGEVTPPAQTELRVEGPLGVEGRSYTRPEPNLIVRRSIRGGPIVRVIWLPRNPAVFNRTGTRTANGHTWPGRAYQGVERLMVKEPGKPARNFGRRSSPVGGAANRPRQLFTKNTGLCKPSRDEVYSLTPAWCRKVKRRRHRKGSAELKPGKRRP